MLLAGGAINGYAVGRKRVGGKETRDLAIIVYVNRKLSLPRLQLADRIPQRLVVPDERAGGGALEFLTDIQEARFAALALTARQRPAAGGISIGHRDITAGTLGGLVRDAVGGEILILSNNHVLADVNQAQLGDPILQPGPLDGGTDPRDRIAQLSGFVEIDFDPGAENRVDAAVAEPVRPEDVLFATESVGPDTPAETRALDENDFGLFLHKTGRTTEHTQGYVEALFATVEVGYGGSRAARFVDQIVVSQSSAEEDFSQGGDSGSLVYDSDNRCVGLLFAGSQGSPQEPARTIINPIDAVLRALDLQLLRRGEHPSGGRPRAAAAMPAAKSRGPSRRSSRSTG
jgi:hypothetical protein